MTRIWLASLTCAALVLACSQPKNSEGESRSSAPESVTVLTSAQESVLVTATATVEAIDHAKREVTLRGPLGNAVTFVVDTRVQRLDEVKVGDEVEADYYVSLAGELRPPTEKEKENPIEVVEASTRAPKDTSPAGGTLRVVKAVATVAGLDLPMSTVTLRGPRGNHVTIRARNVDNLEKMHLGDTIIVTYSEAIAIRVEKVDRKAAK